jgi:hypothetical protein
MENYSLKELFKFPLLLELLGEQQVKILFINKLEEFLENQIQNNLVKYWLQLDLLKTLEH